MNLAWLEELLPAAMVSPRSRVWWALFFALFPLAYVGGVLLELAEESPARIEGSRDRAESIEIAKQFAATKGFNVAGWKQYATAETNKNLLAYYGEVQPLDLADVSALAPAREVQVLFRSNDHKEFRTYLSLTGQVTGYEIGKSSTDKHVSSRIGILNIQSNSTTDSSEDTDNATPTGDAEAIARASLASNTVLNNLVKLGTATTSNTSDDKGRTNVSWDSVPNGHADLTLHISVGVRDKAVVAQRIEAVAPKAKKSNEAKIPTFLNVIYGLFLGFATLYALFRYTKRTLQKEVSHVRTLVVAGLFFISYSTHSYSLGLDELATRVGADTFAKVALFSYISAAVTFSIAGLLVGIAYGSGEGEVREAYPGKLTSLDALLAGRIFSRDVAVSWLFGMAVAGWLLLGHHALGYFFRTDIVDLRSDVMTYTYARLPWLTLLLGKQYDTLLIAVAGLLLPASFLLRTATRKRRRFAWLIVFALFSVLHDTASYSNAASEVLALVVFVCALLLPFFAFDLLAAMVSLSALSYADELARLAAVFPSWTRLAVSLAALAAVSLALATYLALRGRRVREEDVRPLYARNLAERMSMQAEVLAAREAQLRLLPQAAPIIPGIEMAACCLPARGVGGDFYDFFRLDANRVGIFIAQGSDQGLASALCIALAKGVLMHTSLQPLSPTQIITGLEASIAELLESGSGLRISFAYGVMDTRRNVLNYARIGTSPHMVIRRAGINSSPQLERVVSLPDRSKNAQPIYEGAAHTQLGDLVVFFTDGVTSLRSRRFGKREFQWLDLLTRRMTAPAEPLQSSLLAALEKYQNNAADDLTAVVLRVVASDAIAQEVVA